MTNILQLQQDIISLNERVNREIQFGEDASRELVATIDLLTETVGHLRSQVIRVFNDRNASLLATVGQPVRAPMVDMTATEALPEPPKALAEEPTE